MKSPRIIDVHQSLNRHSHLLGAERDLVMISALVTMLVGIGGLTLVGAVTAFVVWIFALIGLRRMAKVDPIMSKVWLRHIRQQSLYSAKSSRWRKIEGYKVK